jgi:hypothetical protein
VSQQQKQQRDGEQYRRARQDVNREAARREEIRIATFHGRSLVTEEDQAARSDSSRRLDYWAIGEDIGA